MDFVDYAFGGELGGESSAEARTRPFYGYAIFVHSIGTQYLGEGFVMIWDYIPDIGICVFSLEQFGYLRSHRTPYGGHLEAVGQAVMDEDASGQREHLRLVLQSPEGG